MPVFTSLWNGVIDSGHGLLWLFHFGALYACVINQLIFLKNIRLGLAEISYILYGVASRGGNQSLNQKDL